MSKETIVNKVKANTKLISIDLADMFYDDTPIVVLDIKDFLHMGLLLREVEFRSHLEQYDWNQFGNKYLSVICSTDAIIPPWAWMLITTHASPFAKEVFHLSPNEIIHEIYQRGINMHDWNQYKGKYILLKGCGDIHIPDSIYLLATNKLMKTAKKMMYGEACSFVPVWKN